MTQAVPVHSQTTTTPVARLFGGMRNGSPPLWASLAAMVLGLALCLVMLQVSSVSFNGISAWDKPAKFFLSLIVQFATVSWALSLLPIAARKRRDMGWAIALMTCAAWFELAYIAFRAARGEASHFNDSSALAQAAYAVMGLGALTLTATAGFIGWRLLRQRGDDLMRQAAGLGLVVGMGLGTIAGITISAHGSHWVGGQMTDAHGVGFFAWSSTGGDLRIAHFIGLHAAQGVPLAALSGQRKLVYATAAGFVVLTLAALGWALMGQPLFRLEG